MIILFKIDDLLFNIFPSAREGMKNDVDSIKDELIKYYTLGPYKPTVTIEGEMVRIEIDTSTISTQKSDFDAAIKLCESEKFNKAKPILEKLIKKNPTVSEYHRIYGQILSGEGNSKVAVRYLIDALRWDPKNTHALTMLGNIYARDRNDISTAMTYYEHALAVKPDDFIAMNNIGANLMQLGRLVEAERYFEQAYSINDSYPNTLYALGMVKKIKGDAVTAFDYAIKTLKRVSTANPIYNNAFELAQEASIKAIEKIDASDMFNQFSQKLATESGKVIDVEQDDSVPTPAKLEIAENYDRDRHVIRYKKDRLAIDHLMMHELGHLDLTVKCRRKNANYLFVATSKHKEQFIKDNESTITRLNREGLEDKAIADFITALFNGINSQTYNTPVDLFIEDFLFNTYPSLRPFQFLSLLSC
jgi:tetratricopeptide (TPR) repeat protein